MYNRRNILPRLLLSLISFSTKKYDFKLKVRTNSTLFSILFLFKGYPLVITNAAEIIEMKK